MTTHAFDLHGLGLGLAAENGVLRRPAMEALDEAALIIARARESAARIEAEARTAYEAEKRRGAAEGRAEAAQADVRRLVAEHAALDRQLAGIELGLADLVHASVRQILRSYDNRDLTREVTRTALAAMRSEKRAQLHVAPEAEETIRANLSDLLADYPEMEMVDVIADPALTAPALRLESELGVVDFELENNLTGFLRLLQGR